LINLLIATRNAHKVAEIQSILGREFRCLALSGIVGAPDVVEDQATFAGNAAKKAEALANWLATNSRVDASRPQFVLADDSGLEVDALDGAPGVYSARFAALDGGLSGNSPTAANNAKLLRLLQNVPLEKRTARFRCVIALTPMSKSEGASSLTRATELFDGACEGRIAVEPRGDGGFGYDPLFTPIGYEQTFAELGEETKNEISHRAKALAKLRERFNT
jgi:XTP/dITP diphosphohydrolase